MVSSINFCKLSNIFQRSQSRGQRALITRSSRSLPRPVLSARATSKVHFTTHFPNSAHILQFPLWWRLLRRPWGTVPGVPHLRGRWSRRTCQVQLPLPQWNRLQPTILHLRLVVQRRLFTGKGAVQQKRGGGGRGGSRKFGPRGIRSWVCPWCLWKRKQLLLISFSKILHRCAPTLWCFNPSHIYVMYLTKFSCRIDRPTTIYLTYF